MALLTPLVALPCRADNSWHHRQEPPHYPDPHYGPDQYRTGARNDWHGDIRRFREQDISRWNHGRWRRVEHDGRVGWWWVVGPSWYFYPAPIYPVPDPYRPPLVDAPPAPPGAVWYYCSNPAGYYPYVPACNQWLVVPAE